MSKQTHNNLNVNVNVNINEAMFSPYIVSPKQKQFDKYSALDKIDKINSPQYAQNHNNVNHRYISPIR